MAFRNTPRFYSCFRIQLLFLIFTKYFLTTIKVSIWRLFCLFNSVWLSFHELAHNGFGLGEGGDFHHKC
jgi:hypothetical protein